MQERQEIEQYFFSRSTLDDLADLAAHFPRVCCLCTPSLGAELERRGRQVTTLDLDARFAGLRGFREYDLGNPRPLGERFDLIVCDPPFLSISLEQLLAAVELLSRGDHSQPLLVNYLVSRAATITRVFSPFGLLPTGYRPSYETIGNLGRNSMELFGNLGPEYRLDRSGTSFSTPL